MSDIKEAVTKVVEMAVVHPGDVLVIAVTDPIDRQQLDGFMGYLRAQLPETVKAVVVGGSIQLSVMRAEVTE